jgi:CRISPR/Cas system CSM-associated protein Csm5 (group 7 of RAMP superfamily)
VAKCRKNRRDYQELLNTKESINKEIGPIAAAKKALKVKLEKTKKARQVVENVLEKLEGKHGSVLAKSFVECWKRC